MISTRLERLQALLQENPADSFSLFALAKEQERLGLLNEAALTYQELLNNDPAYLGTYYHYAKLLESLDAEKQALVVYEQGIVRAQAVQDLHTLSELNNARQNLMIELEGL
jgi:tetratricopeptide (TPR) repeat protein